jgi:hypothetical protein
VASPVHAVRMKPFILLASITCQDDGKKCVNVKGEYLEKE